MSESTNLTPTAQAVLDALHRGPATTAELRHRTGRSRSAVDKALAELTKNGHTTKTTPLDGPVRWTVSGTDEPPAPDPSADPDTAPDAEPGAQAPTDPEAADPVLSQPDTAHDTDLVPEPAGPTTPSDIANPTDPRTEQPGPAHETTDPDPGHAPAPETEVKICRGCRTQMPAICPTCWQKTTAYCGTCRRTNPTRRGTGNGPQILANGLPKLARGELERLVTDVLRAQPLPDHLGITGWTPGRVAIHLPGRSTGAIANALDKLTTTGAAQLLGENPKRYQPTPTDDPPDHDHNEHPDRPSLDTDTDTGPHPDADPTEPGQ